MKKTDLGIVAIHWLLFVSILNVSITGLLLCYKEYQPYLTWLVDPQWIGASHIWVSVTIVAILVIYFCYLWYSNLFERLQFHITPIFKSKQYRWKYISILLYWIFFAAVFIETFTGILLTKLINQEVLTQIFYVEKWMLYFVHYYLVWFFLAFPVVHVIIHFLDGGYRKIISIMSPEIYPQKPSIFETMANLLEENARLKEELKKYEVIVCNSRPGQSDSTGI